MKYYVMECEGDPPSTSIGSIPDLPGGTWMRGEKVTVPLDIPIEYALDPEYPGQMKAMYHMAFPLMRNDLAEAIVGAGASNIDFYEAIIKDPRNSGIHTNYRVFNILGLVAAADMEKSEFMDAPDDLELGPDGMIRVDFESLVLDPRKIPAQIKIFRLAECVNAIIVHESLREAVENARIPGMYFYDDGEWSG